MQTRLRIRTREKVKQFPAIKPTYTDNFNIDNFNIDAFNIDAFDDRFCRPVRLTLSILLCLSIMVTIGQPTLAQKSAPGVEQKAEQKADKKTDRKSVQKRDDKKDPGADQKADQKKETKKSPPLPPLTRPTQPPDTMLTPAQTSRHRETVGSLHPDSVMPLAPHVPIPNPDALPGLNTMVNRISYDVPGSKPFCVQIVRGIAGRKEIALTFDDGPHPQFTPKLLDLLKQLNIRATFFVVGIKVDEAPYLLMRMVQEGHEVANHTYHHLNLKKIPIGLVDTEIRMDSDAIRRACGIQPTFFRPPGGQRNEDVIQTARKLNLTTVLWTDDPGDYASPGAAVLEAKLLKHPRDGAIFLLHDGIEQTYAMLPDMVAHLRREGYKFVTLTEMVQHLENTAIVHK